MKDLTIDDKIIFYSKLTEEGKNSLLICLAFAVTDQELVDNYEVLDHHKLNQTVLNIASRVVREKIPSAADGMIDIWKQTLSNHRFTNLQNVENIYTSLTRYFIRLTLSNISERRLKSKFKTFNSLN